jgi:hypothetical protein
MAFATARLIALRSALLVIVFSYVLTCSYLINLPDEGKAD